MKVIAHTVFNLSDLTRTRTNDWVWIAFSNSCLLVPMNKRQNIWKHRWCIYHRKIQSPQIQVKKHKEQKDQNLIQ